MDPLSDVLSLLKARSYMSGSFDLGGDWSFRFGPSEGIKFFAVASGGFWVAVDGGPEPTRLRAGDCFLLPHGRPFRLTSNLGLAPQDVSVLLERSPDGEVRTLNGGGGSFSTGGYVAFEGPHAERLLSALPPVVHIGGASDRAAMRWCLERLTLEVREPRPGGSLVAQQLGIMVVVQALRLHLARESAGRTGWRFALSDKHVGAALQAMHAQPARPWTLQLLAEEVGMSRTAFATSFKAKVGQSPMAYLTEWRMLVAGDRLAGTSDPVADIALSVGYDSASAFSTAFKRVLGASPKRFDRARSA